MFRNSGPWCDDDVPGQSPGDRHSAPVTDEADDEHHGAGQSEQGNQAEHDEKGYGW